MSRYLLDTWAWIEFYEGSNAGAAVDGLLESSSDCFTSIASIAELSDNFHRKDIVRDYSWEQLRGYVETNTEILLVTPRIASEAGKIKVEKMEQKPDFGLMDAIILATAREHNLKLLSGDPHLDSQPEAVDISKLEP